MVVEVGNCERRILHSGDVQVQANIVHNDVYDSWRLLTTMRSTCQVGWIVVKLKGLLYLSAFIAAARVIDSSLNALLILT